jgi:hypothetical protein
MSERLKYVSPEYQAQLDALAETLVTSRRFGRVVLYASEMGTTTAPAPMLEDTVEFPAVQEPLFTDEAV